MEIKMEKPISKQQFKKAYDYNEVIHYIEDKYEIKTRDYQKYYKGDMSGDDCPKPCGEPYLDFWHWFIEGRDVHDGSTISMNILDELEQDNPKWVKEILTLIQKEFEYNDKDEEGSYYFYICW